MSVVSVTRRWSGRQGGEETRNASTSNQDATIIFDVLTDDASDDESVVLLNPGIPIPLQSHPTRIWLRAARRRANQIGPYNWEVTVEYESIQGGQGNNSPLDAPPKIRWATLHRDEEIDRDYKGDPICAVTGEPFDPRPRTNKPDLLLVVTRNLRDFNPGVIIPYMMNGGAVSSDVFLNQPPGTARMHDMEASSQEAEDFIYWTVTAQVRFRRGGSITSDENAFCRRIMAQGYYVKVPVFIANPPWLLLQATDGTGSPVSKPVPHYVRETTVEEPDPNNPNQTITVTRTPGEQIKPNFNNPWPVAQFYEFQDFDRLPFATLGIL